MKKNSTSSEETKHYDIVIVGCGAAAIGLLYGLLLPFDGSSMKKPDFSIAVIERGEEKKQPFEDSRKDPKQWFKASHLCFRNEKQSDAVIYESVPQQGLHNRKIFIPTGKGVGGGTNINATLLTRPSEDDFVTWPSIWKEKVDSHSVTYRETKRISRIMSAIQTIEDAIYFNYALSTQSGINMSSQHEIIRSRHESFIKIKELEDISKIKLHSFNCAVKKTGEDSNEGVNSRLEYERVNAYEALIVPLLERNPFLKEVVNIYTNVQVERILIEKTKNSSSQEFIARGVECKHISKKLEHFKIMAKRRVVLCAGAILSPALLLVSGIGNQLELEREGIEPLHSKNPNQWKSVGKKLRDHLLVAKGFFIPPKFWSTMKSVNAIRGWAALDILPPKDRIIPMQTENTSECNLEARVFLKVVDGTSSSLIIPYVLASYFYRQNRIKQESKVQNIISLGLNHLFRIIFYFLLTTLLPLFQFPPLKWLLTHRTAQIILCLLNPDSIGYIKIRRNCQYSSVPDKRQTNRLSQFDILVNPGYLSNKADITRIKNSWEVLDHISRHWFSNCNEIIPGSGYKKIYGNGYVQRYSADFGLPFFHFSGSIAMKVDSPTNDNRSNDDDDYSFVVDEKLNVRGVVNLYVCDASVLPSNISGPTALTCLGLGFVASSLIDNDFCKMK